MHIYDTKRNSILILDNVEEVTLRQISYGFEIIFKFISGNHHSLIFRDEEVCMREYKEILSIMTKEVK